MTREDLERAQQLVEELDALERPAETSSLAFNRHLLPVEVRYSDDVLLQLDDLPGEVRERISNSICSLIRSEYERVATAFRQL